MTFKHEVKSNSPGILLLLVALSVPAFTLACGGNGSDEGTTSSSDASTEQETTDTTESDTEDTAGVTTDSEDPTATESTSDADETTAATTGDGDGDTPDLDECLRADLSFELDQPLNTIDAAQKEQLCAWYQSVWQCALDREAMCVSEGLRAGEKVLTETNDGVAACKDAEQKCIDNGPKALETLESCLEVDVITTCEGSLADYLLCMRANFTPIEQVQRDQYTCDELSEYVEQSDQEWVAPAECDAFTETCDFDAPE